MSKTTEPKTDDDLARLHAQIIRCRACPRLVAWREKVAKEKRRAFRNDTYWGRPLPGFGDRAARIVIVGLAPAAHGGNRTGRFFTGDRSGEFLFAGLYRAGLANQPTSTWRDDGLELTDVYILAPVRCAPPDNAPTPEEFRNCSTWFDRELALLRPKLYLALGAHAWASTLKHLERTGHTVPKPRPKFAHGAVARIAPDVPPILGCFHVSQQNTQTGRLTPAMFDEVIRTARKLVR